MPRIILHLKMLYITIILLISTVTVKGIGIPAGPLGDVQFMSGFASDVLGVIQGDLSLDVLLTGSGGLEIEKLSNKMDNLTSQLTEMSGIIDKKLNRLLFQVMVRLPLAGKLDAGMREMHNYIVQVDGLYIDYVYYISSGRKFNNHTLINFAETVTNHQQGSMKSSLHRMYRLVAPGRSAPLRDGLMNLVAQDLQVIKYQ